MALTIFAAWINVPVEIALADANSIRGLVSEHCTRCHLVPGFRQSRQTQSILAPGFVDIANKSDIYTLLQ